MELSELSAYAKEKYDMREERKWDELPGFSVLSHPQTGKWVALLMRQWDSERGEEIQRCDLKCGRQSLTEFPRPYLGPPLRMKGPKWISVSFGRGTDPALVRRLFDRAVSSGEQRGFTVVLDSLESLAQSLYQETAIPFSAASERPAQNSPSQRIRQMRRLYRDGSAAGRHENFLRQARYMEDFEDDFPWEGSFLCYYPTYRDLTTDQLRAYFSWRTKARKGDFRPIPSSAAYIYIYELLNGVGASSPVDTLKKLELLEEGFVVPIAADSRMQQNLRRWMAEFAVLNGLPPEVARRYADPAVIAADDALLILKEAEKRSDAEVFSALCVLSGAKLKNSPVMTKDPLRGERLVSGAWRKAAAGYRRDGSSLFTLCFKNRTSRRWYPLANAVYRPGEPQKDRGYELSELRSYRLRNGAWYVYAYDKDRFDRALLRGFTHECDLLLRRYLKTGRYLKQKSEDSWADPYINEAIEEEIRALEEAKKSEVVIDLSGLEQIRRDAIKTRDSLLTEEDMEPSEEGSGSRPRETEEREEPAPEAAPRPEEAYPAAEGGMAEMLLSGLQLSIVRELLAGGDAASLMREERVMPSVAADGINEALYGALGDSVIVCEGAGLSLIEDYEEELREMFGGSHK